MKKVKLSERELDAALLGFRAILSGWSSCSRADLDRKIAAAYTEAWAIKASDGPHKKALADLKPLLVRQANLKEREDQ